MHFVKIAASAAESSTRPTWNSSTLQAALADLARRYESGERPSAKEYFVRFPELAANRELALQLIYEEFCLRYEHGETPTTQEFRERYPQWSGDFEKLVECHDVMHQEDTAFELPNVDGNLADYTILAQLGQGGQGRVFLATQNSLADRPVVLKVTSPNGREHLTLARLQHTNIVPLLNAYDDREKNLRLMCMPYFGGGTIEQLLRELEPTPIDKRTGRRLVEVLDRLQADSLIVLTAKSSQRDFLAQATYVEAVCWMGARLAEALQFAHERGFVHFDVKPGNVLIAADGQPMLLDFHIAQKSIYKGVEIPSNFGATPVYMSPEQHDVLNAMQLGGPAPCAVGNRSDIFSLGLILCEALGGRIHQCDSEHPAQDCVADLPVSAGLRSILAKSIASRPDDRYQNAAAMADDLRRHLQDQPLQGVPNRSLLERWQKWRRRNPVGVTVAFLIAAVLAAACSLLVFHFRQSASDRRQADLAMHEGKTAYERRNYLEAATSFQRGLEYAASAKDRHFVDALTLELRKAQRAHFADQLHQLAEKLRRAYDSEPNLADDWASLAKYWRQIWAKRNMVATREDRILPNRIEQRMAVDFLDVALLWTELHVRLATTSDEKTQARKEALKILAEFEASFGGNLLLHLEHQALADTLGDFVTAHNAKQKADRLVPQSAWELFMLGRRSFRTGHFDRAFEYLTKATEKQPEHFWAHFYTGLTALRTAKFHDAEVAFRICIAIDPNSAEAHCNLGVVQMALKSTKKAPNSLNRALKIDPDFGAAVFNRGILRYQQQRYDISLADFERSLLLGHESAQSHYYIALIHTARQDNKAAVDAALRSLQLDPQLEKARVLLKQLDSN